MSDRFPKLNWKTLLEKELVQWLLAGEPWVVYHTLTDLLDKDEKDNVVVTMRTAIHEHPLVKNIFERLNEDGYWGRPKDIHTWWQGRILLSGYFRC